jgi:metal-responsive CopG/Arc/MetJ family transcriptional regulator
VGVTTKAGRPAIGPAIQIRIPADMLAEIDATAAAEGVTRVQWIRQAVAARLHAAHRDGLDR